MRVFTLETRLNKVDAKYFEHYISFYNKVYRKIWQYYIHGGSLSSNYITYICKKYNLMKRTVNSIVRDIKGRYKALKELQKRQCNDLEYKIQLINNTISKLKSDISFLSKLAGKNQLDESNLSEYRNKKKRLFSLQSKKLKYKNTMEKMRDIHKLSFGSKEFLNKRHHLHENCFNSHIGWYNQYVRKRDRYIYYIGSGDEVCGNQMFQMQYDDSVDYFHCKIRKENVYSTDDKYTYLDVNFKSSRRDILISTLKCNKAVSYRVLRRNKKWYLQVMFSAVFNIVTDKRNGCLGVDFNDGFLAVTETDTKGNISDTGVFKLQYHGGGNKAKTEMEGVVKDLVLLCRYCNKALVVEDLNFSKKKLEVVPNRSKGYNRMLHRLDYSRFIKLCDNCATVYGVEFVKVNPAYTSKIAKHKYCEQRKLNTHIGASYVIARRGQGFYDNLAA